jgi:hypothetical protein
VRHTHQPAQFALTLCPLSVQAEVFVWFSLCPGEARRDGRGALGPDLHAGDPSTTHGRAPPHPRRRATPTQHTKGRPQQRGSAVGKTHLIWPPHWPPLCLFTRANKDLKELKLYILRVIIK